MIKLSFKRMGGGGGGNLNINIRDLKQRCF